LLDEILSVYDHHYLNELTDFIKLNPTAENIAYIISKKIRKKLPQVINLKVYIWESSQTGACYFDAM